MNFLFDATFPAKLGRALAELSRDHSFIHVDDRLGRGATDEAVIRTASAEGWFLVTLDQGITRNPAKREALIQGRVVCVYRLSCWESELLQGCGLRNEHSRRDV